MSYTTFDNNSRDPKPYILVGPTGSGKTTLLLYYFDFLRKDQFFHLYLDLTPLEGIELPQIWGWLYDKMYIKITESYPECFNNLESIREVLKNFRPPEAPIDILMQDTKDVPFYIPLVINYIICKYNKKVVISFDNCDTSRPDKIQRIKTFTDDFATKVHAFIIFTIRDYTPGGLQTDSIYQHLVPNMWIDPPDLKEIIEIRLQKAFDVLSNFPIKEITFETSKTGDQKIPSMKYTVTRDKVKEFIKASIKYLSEKDGIHSILPNIEKLCNYNVRNAIHTLYYFYHSSRLDLVPLFLYTFNKEMDSLKRGIDFRDFIECVMAIHYRFYDYKRSPIINLFDLRGSTIPFCYQNTLVLHRILMLLKNLGKIKVTEITYRLGRLCYTPDDIELGIEKLLGSQLIESSLFQRPEPQYVTELKITEKGKFFIDYMVKRFSYLYYVAERTPMGRKYIVNITDKIGAPGINSGDPDLRIESVRKFTNFIKEEESIEKKSKKGGTADTLNYILYSAKQPLSKVMEEANNEGRQIKKYVKARWDSNQVKTHLHPE
jgi:hypothetical protein